jgi:tetratricopeptide (TPR) repeat protein
MAAARTGGWGRLATAAAGASLILACAAGLGWFAWAGARVAVLRDRAEVAVAEADWGRAESTLARLFWYKPDDLEASRLRVEVSLQRGDPAAAAGALAAVPESSPEAGSARLRRGLILKELFRTREAEDAFRAAIRLLPREPEPRRELIALLGVERRGDQQRRELWGLHDRTGRKVEALRFLAQSVVLIPPGTLAKAVDEGFVLERCLAADPDDPNLRPPLARFYRRRGESDAARRLLEPRLQSHLDDPAARVEWLAGLVDEGQVEAAAPWFERVPGPLGAVADYRRLRGDWLALQDRHADALADFQEARRLDPLDPDTQYRLARCLRTLGRDAEADEAQARHRRTLELAELAAGVSEDGRDASRLVAVGRACRALGREREARGWFVEALRVDPENAEARASLLGKASVRAESGGGGA